MSGEHWVLGEVGSCYVLLADLGRPDFTVNLFRYRVERLAVFQATSSTRPDAVLFAAQRALQASPLSLQTRTKIGVLGISPRRTSTVLGNRWNEEVTVRIDVSESEGPLDPKVHDFSFEVSTSIAVNEQKDKDHWHQPSPAQTKTWSDAVRIQLLNELTRLCVHPSSQDNFTIVCQ
jgi:hypothetical protein